MATPIGSPIATRLARATRAFGWLSIAWFVFIAFWGLFRANGGGHYAAPLANAISAENMIKWRIIAPVWEYVPVQPLPSSYYCHHPFGNEWALVLPFAIFGHHDWVVFAVPAAMSAATVWLLFDLGKRVWGILGGAAAAAGFAICPIALSYSNFLNVEVMTIFGCALFFWGHARLLETWKVRFAFVSAFGAWIATNGEWVGFIVVGVVLGWGMLRAFVLPKRLLPRIKFEPYTRWWVVTATVAVAVGLFYVVLFFHYGKIDDLIGSANVRGGGGGMSLEQVLLPRKHRIELMFPPPIIFIGKLAAPIALLRFLIRRRDEEVYSIAALITSTVHYLGFKNGADVHVFWPHYYALYFALGFAQLVVTFQWLVKIIVARWRPAVAATVAGTATLVLVVAYCVALLPDAYRVTRHGRDTWGRFNEEVLRNESDAVRTLQLLSSRLPKDAYVEASSSLRWSWQDSWALHGLHRDSGPPTRTDVEGAPFWIGRASNLGSATMTSLAKSFRLELYGDIVVIDKRQSAAPLSAFTFREHEPNPVEWYLFGGVEPVWTMTYDPYATWEWRTLLDQPAEIPPAPPTTLEEKRIAHNIAVANGDTARADALTTELRAAMEPQPTGTFQNGTELFGVHRIGGASPRLEIWFVQTVPADNDFQFGVHSVVLRKRAWSFIDPDALDRDVGSLVPIPPKLVKKGFYFKAVATLYSRVGVERFYGAMWNRDSSRAIPLVGHAEPQFDLAIVE